MEATNTTNTIQISSLDVQTVSTTVPKTGIIILRARDDTKIKVSHEEAKKSQLITTWYDALEKKEKSSTPELPVNFSPDDIHKFLDFLSYNFCADANSEKMSLLCSYFGVESDIGRENSIIVEKVLLKNNAVSINLYHKFYKQECKQKGNYTINKIIFGCYFKIDKKKRFTVDRIFMDVNKKYFDEIDDAFSEMDIQMVNELIKNKLVIPNKEINISTSEGIALLSEVVGVVVSIYEKNLKIN